MRRSQFSARSRQDSSQPSEKNNKQNNQSEKYNDFSRSRSRVRKESPSQNKKHILKTQKTRNQTGRMNYIQQKRINPRNRLSRLNCNPNPAKLKIKSHKITEQNKLKNQQDSFARIQHNQNWQQNIPKAQNSKKYEEEPQSHSQILDNFFIITKRQDSILIIPKQKYKDFLSNIRKYGPTKQNLEQFGKHFLPIDISMYSPRQATFIEQIISKLLQKNIAISESNQLLFLEHIFGLLISESKQMLQQLNLQLKRYYYAIDSIKFLKKAKLACFKHYKSQDQQAIN